MRFDKVKLTWIVFWALAAVFAVILGIMFIPGAGELVGAYFMLVLGIALVLGIVLFYLAARLIKSKKLKIYLMMTGAGAAGILIFAVFHNVFYALGVVSGGIAVLKTLFSILDIIFFVISVIVCPVAVLIGVVGSVVSLIRNKN